MRQVASRPIYTSALSCLGAMAGNASYHWWRHGATDWIGVAEFGLGWVAAGAGISLLVKMKDKRQQTAGNEGNV
jgi:uncharacterized membrane protein YfcA